MIICRRTKRGWTQAAAGDGGAELAERHASHLRFLAVKDVLRDQWGFKGITVSDHGQSKS